MKVEDNIIKLIYKCDVVYLDSKTIKDRYNAVENNSMSLDLSKRDLYEIISYNSEQRELHLKTITT